MALVFDIYQFLLLKFVRLLMLSGQLFRATAFKNLYSLQTCSGVSQRRDRNMRYRNKCDKAAHLFKCGCPGQLLD